MAILTVLVIEANMAIVRLLRLLYLTHNQKDPSDSQSKRMGTPVGNLDGLMNPFVSISLIA